MIRLLLLFVMGCTNVHVNRTALVTSTAALACDWAQTRASAAEGWNQFVEENPVMGASPSVRVVDAYFLTVAAINTTIWYLLPERFKSVLPVGVTVAQAKTIHHNNQTIGWCK